MKVALVHDDLVQWGGAERVLAALSEIFPGAPIFTSVYDTGNVLLRGQFGRKNIRTSFLQGLPFWRGMYKQLLPLYPIAFEQFNFDEFEVVISQTTRFAKSILTKPQTTHICYCHTPPRFLWNFSGESVKSRVLGPYFSYLRRYDLVSAGRVDRWIAGSVNAQRRIKKVYGEDSEVIYPFVDFERLKGVKGFSGGYLLVVARLNRYKRIDLVIRSALQLGLPLKIVGVGPELGSLSRVSGSPEVQFLGQVPESLLYQLIAGCFALVIAGEEDFGLTSLEAQALGKPVVALKRGGVLETVIDRTTGYLFEEQTISSLSQALQKLRTFGYNRQRCLAQARRFSKESFASQFRNLLEN